MNEYLINPRMQRKDSYILFADDWKKRRAFLHVNTKNRSFVHLARLLKSMGVRNHAFMLALYDLRLADVDPFSENLTDEQISWITQEAYLNPWYYLREIARAPSKAGSASRMVEANRGNVGLFWMYFNHVMVLLIQPRQTGKSFNADLLAAYLLQIACKGTSINLLTKDEKLRRVNIQRIKDIMGAFPRYLDLRSAKDANNTEVITVLERDNRYEAHLPQMSEKLAANAARGFSSENFFVDEPPFQPNIHESLPAALGAGGAMRDIAEENGSPYGTVLTTTAGKKDTKEGAYIYNLMCSMAEFTDRFFDATDREDLYKMIRANSRDKEVRVNITLNHNQLGKDDEWLKRKLSESVSTGDKADRDYFNRWTSGTASSPLSIEQLEAIRRSEKPPAFNEVAPIGGYITRWYVPEHEIQARMNAEDVLVVFDTSEASGGDDISMRVTGIRTGTCLAAGTFNNTNILTFSEWVAGWVVNWERTTLLIERRSTGSSVLDVLLRILPAKGINPFKRIFNLVVNNPEKYKSAWETIALPMWRWESDFLDLNKGVFGFATSASGMTSRRSLYGQVLNSAANTVGHMVVDKTTIDQITSLIVKDGRVDHPKGEHDDMVIAWVLTHWFMTKATNLRHYGIDATSILASVKEAKPKDPMTKLKEQQQMVLKSKIKDLVEQLKNTTDVNMTSYLEHQLRVAYSRLQVDENEKLSLDDLIESIKQEKIKNRLIKRTSHIQDVRDKRRPAVNTGVNTNRANTMQSALTYW